MSEKITIYMPVYNGSNYIENAIKSILKQSYKDFIVIISDNNSKDNTVEIIKKYLYDERVKLVSRPENIGMIGNGNACLKLINTKYFMGICHDDYFYDDRALEKGVQILESMPDIPVVYCDMMFVDGNNKPLTKKNTGFRGQVSSDGLAKKSIISGRNLYSIPLLIRTSAIGSFIYSEDFYHTSDIDFSIWIGRHQEIVYLPDTLFALRFHGSNYTARKFDTLNREFLGLADKYNIKLSFFEKLAMRFNHRFNYLRRTLFYLYLDIFRK